MTPAITATDLERQRTWSLATFGPGRRSIGICEHIRRELEEIESDPSDVSEWADVVILALDGAWRAGWTPTQILEAIHAKWQRNRQRSWPDWRTLTENDPIEHMRGSA
jgi:hypothetical protein